MKISACLCVQSVLLVDCPADVIADEVRGEIAACEQRLVNRRGWFGITQRDRDVAKPAFIAYASNRTAFRPCEPLVFSPREQIDKVGIIETVPWLEVIFARALGKLVPGAE